MLISVFWVAMVAFSLVAGIATGNRENLTASALEGAAAGVQTALSIGGGLCLWGGLSVLLEKSGGGKLLAKLLTPLLGKLFPDTAKEPQSMGHLCGNFTANLLGLGSAATPMGIAAVKGMKERSGQDGATDEMCRLIVLNTASIQLIPSTVAAVRAGLGAARPLDILPAVWLASLLSAAFGLAAAWLFSRKKKRHG